MIAGAELRTHRISTECHTIAAEFLAVAKNGHAVQAFLYNDLVGGAARNGGHGKPGERAERHDQQTSDEQKWPIPAVHCVQPSGATSATLSIERARYAATFWNFPCGEYENK